MNRQGRIALALLAGLGGGIGVLLWLAIATSRLPDDAVLIALGIAVMAAAALIPTFLPNGKSGECQRASRGCG